MLDYKANPMAQVPLQTRIPQQHEYSQLGAYLRDLREHFALDVAEVARRTHIRAKYIQAMEDEQLDLLPGKVYARGYVVTYAEFFGLAAEDFANQYMAQFGVTQTPTKEAPQYFMPEPKRRQLSRGGVNMAYVGVAAVLIGVAAYMFIPSEKVDVAASDVMQVPESMVDGLRNAVMPHVGNYDCLYGVQALSCFAAARAPEVVDFVQAPAMFYVAGDAVAEPEEDATDATDEENVEAPVVEEAVPEPVKETEAKKPEAVESAPVVTTAPAPVSEQVTPEPLPFKRQGEEAPPVVQKTEDTKAEKQNEAPAPDAPVVEAPKEETQDSLLPAEWFGDAEPSYEDPNAKNDDQWTPRRRR